VGLLAACASRARRQGYRALALAGAARPYDRPLSKEMLPARDPEIAPGPKRSTPWLDRAWVRAGRCRAERSLDGGERSVSTGS
jgi:hypothetical protein